MGTGIVLLVSGALDESRRVDIDAVPSSTVVGSTAARPQDSVMISYLTAFDTWNECVKGQPPEATSNVVSSACGTLPEQPDDPQLNRYLADVLDWNKCAAPRLRHGGVQQAVIACGPQPVSPIGR